MFMVVVVMVEGIRRMYLVVERYDSTWADNQRYMSFEGGFI